MPLDVHEFSSPVSNYEGLYKIGDDIRQKNEREGVLKQHQAANAKALVTAIGDLADPKDHLTGTDYDPHIVGRYGELFNKGTKLLADNPNMDANTLNMLLAKDVNRLAVESENLKAIERQRKETEKLLPASVDKDKFNEEFKNRAFYDVDANGNRILKDITAIDPTKNIGDDVLRNGNVYNSSGFDEVFKNSQNVQDIKKFKTINSRGGYDAGDYEVTTKSYLTPNIDIKTQKIDPKQPFVPKYQEVQDNDAALIHTFNNDGQNVKAPIRVLDDAIFNNLPNSAKAYALQEARKHLIDQVDPLTNKSIKADDPRVEMFAKAVAYDELNSDLRKSGVIKKQDVLKATPIKNITNINNGNGKSTTDETVNIANAFDKITSPSNNFDITNGVVKRKKDGSLYDGEMVIPLKYVPADILNSVKALNKDGELEIDDSGRVKFNVKNGKIDAVLTNAGFVDRGTQKSGQEKNIGVPAKKRSFMQKLTGTGKPKAFDVVDPNGNVVMQGVDEITAKKAQAKGYKIK